MSFNKKIRQQVWRKFNGHCSYCGKEISVKEMQVDHFVPKYTENLRSSLFPDHKTNKTDHIDNLMPSCRRCNHYKRAYSIDVFRDLMKTIHERISKNYIVKVGIDYGIIEIKPFGGTFYFEIILQNQ